MGQGWLDILRFIAGGAATTQKFVGPCVRRLPHNTKRLAKAGRFFEEK